MSREIVGEESEERSRELVCEQSRQIDFHQQWRLLTNEDNNSHDPMLLTSSVLFLLRDPAAETTDSAFIISLTLSSLGSQTLIAVSFVMEAFYSQTPDLIKSYTVSC